MKHAILLISFFSCIGVLHAYAQTDVIKIKQSAGGFLLTVNDKPTLVKGINWDYYPIGTNYAYILWDQPEKTIKGAIDAEMSLFADMGINSIRVYTGIPKKWIEYIYKNFGIYTMLNHSFGRYGLNIDGSWQTHVDYSDPKVKTLLLDELIQLAEDYKDTPGLLLYLLGNENNYGLFWEGGETENIPLEDRQSTRKAVPMYRLFNEGANAIKQVDSHHPVAMCNGDLLFLDIISKECKDLDIFGINVYRGVSFGNLFDRAKKELGKPVLLTEFGADAYNVVKGKVDEKSQAMFCLANLQEIYENVAGMGKSGVVLGGFVFQSSDGWWKYGQDKNLTEHDVYASWTNGGYYTDYRPGKNNMNEEWFGICAKGKTNKKGLYKLYPRAAYHGLKKAFTLQPYQVGIDTSAIREHFSSIRLSKVACQARYGKIARYFTSREKVTTGLKINLVRDQHVNKEMADYFFKNKKPTHYTLKTLNTFPISGASHKDVVSTNKKFHLPGNLDTKKNPKYAANRE